MTYEELGFTIHEEDGLLWLKNRDGKILCEVVTACDGETNDEMYDAGYTPLDLPLGYWIHEFDSKEIFG